MNNKEIAKKVVDRICEMIAEGRPLPWVQPWNREADKVRVVDGYKEITLTPTAWNRQGKPYKGANTYLPKGEYITFNQAQKEGGKVRRGAKGFPVVYWNFKHITETDPDTGEQVQKTLPILKYYTVFRVEDVEGITQKHNPKPEVVRVPLYHYEPTNPDSDLNDTAEQVVADYIARAGNGFEVKRDKDSDRAYYSPMSDYVRVPRREQFTILNEFYSTLFHELAHSTGHKTRLNRFTGKAAYATFGSEEYSREELVAESTAASILNALGLEEANTFRNSAAYIKSWANAIKNDPLMYVTATTRAQAAFDLILGVESNPEELTEQ